MWFLIIYSILVIVVAILAAYKGGNLASAYLKSCFERGRKNNHEDV